MVSLHAILSNTGFGVFGLLFTAVIGVVLGHHLDPCNMRHLPDFANGISQDDCVSWLGAAAAAGPPRSADFVALLTIAVRIEASFFVALSLGAFYLLTQPVAARRGAAVVYGMVCVAVALVDASHAGLVPYGQNALMTESMAAASVPLTAIWCFLATCFIGSVVLGSDGGVGKAKQH